MAEQSHGFKRRVQRVKNSVLLSLGPCRSIAFKVANVFVSDIINFIWKFCFLLQQIYGPTCGLHATSLHQQNNLLAVTKLTKDKKQLSHDFAVERRSGILFSARMSSEALRWQSSHCENVGNKTVFLHLMVTDPYYAQQKLSTAHEEMLQWIFEIKF